MAIKSSIAYIDSSCNPVMGCSGCRLYSPDPSKNICYAADLIRRYAGCKGWPSKFTEPEYFPGRLEKAIGWKDLTETERLDKSWLNGLPRIIFVNDMSDGFAPGGVEPHVWLPPDIVGRMANSPHIWLFLTKWPQYMRMYFSSFKALPSNFWFGVSTLDEDDTWKLRELFRLSPFTRNFFASYEPALGKFPDLNSTSCHHCKGEGKVSYSSHVELCLKCRGAGHSLKWIIAGAGSGRNAPDAKDEWFTELLMDTRDYSIPFFFKQRRTKAEGRLLLGVEYSEMPFVRGE